MYTDIDNTQLNSARENTYFNDITNYNCDDVNDSDLQEFACECYKVIDDKASVMADFTNDCNVMPFDADEWLDQFKNYLLSLFIERMIDHLEGEFFDYMNDSSNHEG